jgi:hypothetical protein
LQGVEDVENRDTLTILHVKSLHKLGGVSRGENDGTKLEQSTDRKDDFKRGTRWSRESQRFKENTRETTEIRRFRRFRKTKRDLGSMEGYIPSTG